MGAVSNIKSFFSSTAYHLSKTAKEFTTPSTLALDTSLDHILYEESVEEKAMRKINSPALANTKTPKKASVDTLNHLYSNGIKTNPLESYISIIEGTIQPLFIGARTVARSLLLAGRIETLFLHGTLTDFTKYAFFKIKYDEFSSNITKRSKNIVISSFRILYAPQQALDLIRGSLVGIVSPLVGSQIRRQVHELDLTFDKMELANTTSKEILDFSACKVKKYWFECMYSRPMVSQEKADEVLKSLQGASKKAAALTLSKKTPPAAAKKPMRSIKAFAKGASLLVSNKVKELSMPSTAQLYASLDSMLKEASPEEQVDLLMKNLSHNDSKNLSKERLKLFEHLYSTGMQISVKKAFHSVSEGILQPIGLGVRTNARCLLLAGRIETLLLHGTLTDVAKFALRKTTLKEVLANISKRANNIFITTFRILYAPQQALDLMKGSLVGIVSPLVGSQIRRQVHELDMTFNKMELANTTSKEIHGAPSFVAKKYWFEKWYSHPIMSQEKTKTEETSSRQTPPPVPAHLVSPKNDYSKTAGKIWEIDMEVRNMKVRKGETNPSRTLDNSTLNTQKKNPTKDKIDIQIDSVLEELKIQAYEAKVSSYLYGE